MTTLAKTRPFFKLKVPRPSPTSESARTFDLVLLDGESEDEGGWFSFSIRGLTGARALEGVERTLLAGDGPVVEHVIRWCWRLGLPDAGVG